MGSYSSEEMVLTPRFVGQGQIDFEPKPVPEPGPGQLLIRAQANAVCGSERGQFYQGSTITPGHEAAGVVVAAGSGTQTAVGTAGVIYLMDYCGECRSCRLGFTNQCLHKRADMGFSQDGGYGPYEVVHENIFFPIPADLSAAEATLLLDIIGTGGHALRRAALIHPDIQSVAVAGAGPIGLGVLAMAKLLLGEGCPVLVADSIPYRLELAARLGAVPVQVKDQSLAQAALANGLQGIDVTVDTSGRTAARQGCLQASAKRGVLVCVGHGEDVSLQVSPDLIAPERAVLGSEYFLFRDLPDNLKLLLTHRDRFSAIITHRFPVQEIQAAFETFFAGNTGKVIVLQ